jgi:hypothetical protein
MFAIISNKLMFLLIICLAIAVEKLKRYKSPGTDQILAELTETVCKTLHSEIYTLLNCIWNKEDLPQQ